MFRIIFWGLIRETSGILQVTVFSTDQHLAAAVQRRPHWITQHQLPANDCSQHGSYNRLTVQLVEIGLFIGQDNNWVLPIIKVC